MIICRTILSGTKLDALQRARRVRARGEADQEDGPVDRLPAERAARDGGPGLSRGAGRVARKARIKERKDFSGFILIAARGATKPVAPVQRHEHTLSVFVKTPPHPLRLCGKNS